jgi:peptide/nickel transport system ATP-binding protein
VRPARFEDGDVSRTQIQPQADAAATVAPQRPVLSVSNLSVGIRKSPQKLLVTREVGFEIQPGEFVGLVGESGSGKSITGLSILGLLPPALERRSGTVEFDGRDLTKMSGRALRQVRGDDISMIFQEPMSALDPVFTIGHQISETLLAHRDMSRKEARERAIQGLADVGIPSPERRYDDYPHQLSGGMRQRVMIAIALICEPKLLIADEPTTALDVTVQAQIVDLLKNLSHRTGTALLFITHDLGVVAESCTRMLTMYAGEIVEDNMVDDALRQPLHPYTSGLLRSVPRLSARKSRLPSIRGRVPAAHEMPQGCRFQPRCDHAMPGCEAPQALERTDGARVRCWRHRELDLPGSEA